MSNNFCDAQDAPHPAHDWTHKYGSEFHCPGQYVAHVAVCNVGPDLVVWLDGQRFTLAPD